MGSKDSKERRISKATTKVTTHKLDISIPKSRRQHIEGVRQWLQESLENKDMMVGGPI